MARGRWGIVLFLCALALLRPGEAEAHVGAPYPVLLEEGVGPYVVSAVADPDVGTGTFYILITLVGGAAPPPDTVVTLHAEPEDGHRAASQHQAERQETRYGERFVVQVPFDVKGTWQVTLSVEGSSGQGEVSFPVQVTPSGIGWLATVACLLPFVLLGGLWLRGALRQRPSR
jgi:hypothetical protein